MTKELLVWVINPDHPDPIRKLPGGRPEHGESPIATAVRELEEETGVVTNESSLIKLCTQERLTHNHYTYLLEVTEIPKLKERGNEGEIVGTASIEEILDTEDFLLPHLNIIRPILKDVLRANLA